MTITTNVNSNKELSPCVRNCCLDDNDVCVGCYRKLSEITEWRNISESQRKVILARCNQRKKQSLIS